ncbi:MAG: peptide deformylase [Alphaproteobacteria bacterium]|nr:peptide deformylase [Alphaproteobacteria bacterium]
MAILKVATLGHPVLRRVAEEIPPEQILSAPVQRLIADMRQTMVEYNGVGLAAPQVHHSVRLVILEQSGEEMVLINPHIEFLTTDALRSYEGCLSVPDMRAAVDRCAHVRVTGFNERAEPLDFEAEDFNAIVVQHECDHLDGVLYVDRCDTRTLAFNENYRRHGPLDPDFIDDEEE